MGCCPRRKVDGPAAAFVSDIDFFLFTAPFCEVEKPSRDAQGKPIACAEDGGGQRRAQSRANFGACDASNSEIPSASCRCSSALTGHILLDSLLCTMSPVSKPHRDIKVHVPRHNSQRIGPLMTASVEAIAREERVRVDVSQTALEPSSALAQAIVRDVHIYSRVLGGYNKRIHM